MAEATPGAARGAASYGWRPAHRGTPRRAACGALAIAAALTAAQGAWGQAAPAVDVALAEARRDNEETSRRTDGLQWRWTVVAAFDGGRSRPVPETLARIRAKAGSAGPGRVEGSRIRDARRARAYVRARVIHQASTAVLRHERWSSRWTFERSGPTAMAEGGYKSGSEQMTFRYYFDGALAAVANTSARDPRYRALELVPSTIWACSGLCVLRRPSADTGLALGPEDFALLTGKNILNIYGAAWSRQSASGTSLVVTATTRSTPMTTQGLTLILDAADRFAPLQIVVRRPGWTATLRVLHRRVYAGTRVPALVERVVRWRDGTVQRLRWGLVRVAPAAAIRLSIPKGSLVHDTRLLGRDLSVGQVLDAMATKDPRVITYRWPGELPAETALPGIRDRELARRGLLPYGNGSLWFLWVVGGGLLALGFVWSRRARLRPKEGR